MDVTNEAGARELVRSWIVHREAERRRLNLPPRPLPDLAERFGRWAADQEFCAGICRNYRQPTAQAGHLAAARVLRAAALDAASDPSGGPVGTP